MRICVLAFALGAMVASPAAAATTIHQTPASFLAALGTTVPQTEGFETTTYNTLVPSGTTLNGVTYSFNNGRTGRIGNEFSNLGGQGLYSTGPADFFFGDDTVTVSFALPVTAIGGYFNIAPSTTEVLSLTAAGRTVNGGGPADSKDVTTFFFLGIVSDTPFATATFGASPDAASGWNFDNLIFARAPLAVPEPSTWAMMVTGFGIAGATLRARRRRVSLPA